MGRIRPSLSIVLLVGLALSACGGGGGGGEAESTTTTASGEAQSSATAPASTAGTTREIGKTGWFDGFAITVDTAKIDAPAFSTAGVELAVTYENLTDETKSPARGQIVQDGAALQADFENPQIPGAGKAKGTIRTAIKIPGGTGGSSTSVSAAALNAALDKVTLVYGESSDNQTIIPLNSTGAVQSIQPTKLTLSGQLKQKQIVIDLVKGSTAPSYETGDKGKGVLAVQIKLSCTPDCQASGYNVDRESFSVKTPDGQSIVADQSSPYCCEALYPGNVYEGPKKTLNFLVPLPVKGAYTITYANSRLVSEGVPAASAPINVP